MGHVGGVPSLGTVQVLQNQGVHLFHLVEVLRYVTTQLHRELAHLGKLGCRTVQLPTLVAQGTAVDPIQRAETVGAGDALVRHQQVGGLLVIDFEFEGQQVVEQAQVETEVPLRRLLPAKFGEGEVERANNGVAVVVACRCVLVVLVTAGSAGVTCDTPRGAEGQHADDGTGLLHELLVADVPAGTHRGEGTILVATAECRSTVGTQAGVDRILTLVGVVNLLQEAVSARLVVAGACAVQQGFHGGVADAGGHVPVCGTLPGGVGCVHLEAGHTGEAVVGVLEVRIVVQLMTCGELQRLVLLVGHDVTFVAGQFGCVVAAPYPGHGPQFSRAVVVVTGVPDIELDVALIVQLMVVGILAPEFVGDVELGGQVVLLLLPPGQIGACHGVAVDKEVAQFVGRLTSIVLLPTGARLAERTGQGQHVEVVARLVAQGVVLVDAHVGHGSVGAGQDVVAVVLVVVAEGHVHRSTELDAVADVVVQRCALGELVVLLSDDGAGEFVVAGTDAERGLLATTVEVDRVTVFLTKLLHGIQPVGVVGVVVVDVRHFRVVVQLGY